jgi:hypothetical protein
MLEISATVARQYIDAVSTFEALDEAQVEAAQVRGGMYWHAGPPSAPDRDALKRSRDVLQAEAVQELLDRYLPSV